MSKTTSDEIRVRNPSGGHVLVWDPDAREWVNRNLMDLIASFGTGVGAPGAGAKVLAVITVAQTDNFDAAGNGSMAGVGRIFLNLSGADKDFTGMLEGSDGQEVTVFNTEALGGGTANFRISNIGSFVARRFVGQGDGSVPPGGQSKFFYNTTPIAGWYIG